MNREFLINILFLVSINLLIKPFFIFGIDRTVQNTVGAETYGIYFVLLNLTYLLQIFNDFGINSFNNRNIAQHNQLLSKYFPNIIVLKSLLGLFYLAITLGIALIAGYKIYFHLLIFIALNQLLISLIFYLRSNISGLAMYRTDSVLSALDKLIMIFICSVLLWVSPFNEHFKIEYFIYAQTVSLLVTVSIALLIINKHLKKPVFRFKPGFLKLILKESYPFALVIFLMTAYTRIDSIMIEQLLPDGAFEAGVYASAYRLLDASNMMAFLFAGLLLPMFSKLIKEGSGIQSLLNFSSLMIWAGAISLVVSTYCYSEPIMDLLYTDATPYWGEVLRWLMISFIALSGIQVYGTLLTANGDLKRLNFIFLAGVVLNVILNWFLIQQYKASGAAIATVITQFFVLFAQVWLVINIFKFKPRYSSMIRICAFSLGLVLIAYTIKSYLPVIWWVNFGLIILAGLGLALILKLIDIKSLHSIAIERRQV